MINPAIDFQQKTNRTVMIEWLIALLATLGWTGFFLRCLLTPDLVYRQVQPSIQAWADKIALGEVPWVDFPAEYPPLGVYSIAFPGLLKTQGSHFGWVASQSALSLIVTLLAVCVVRKTQFSTVRISKFCAWTMGALFMLGTMKEGWLIWNETLPAVGCLLTATLTFKVRQQVVVILLAALFITFALSKLYLLLLLPFLFAVIWRCESSKLIPVAIGASTAALAFTIFALLNESALYYFYNFHQSRQVEVGSIYAALLTAWSPNKVQTYWHSGSYELVPIVPLLGVFSTLPCLAGVVLLSRTICRLPKLDCSEASEVFALASCAGMGIFFGLNKIGSPNYLVVPLILSLGFISGATIGKRGKMILVALSCVLVLANRGSFAMWTASEDLREVGFVPPICSLVKNLGLVMIFGVGWAVLSRAMPGRPKCVAD